MATDKTPHEETWLSWIPEGFQVPPDDQLITREELLKGVNVALARDGERLSDRTLRELEQQGVLPRPVYKRRDGTVRALYPNWHQWLVWQVVLSREYGQDVQDLRAVARSLLDT